jgi:predicted MFS family arabinose efflux permease
MTWMNAGLPCGMAMGPSLGGIIIDAFGPLSGFWGGGASAAALAVLTLVTIPLWRKQ